MIKIRSLNREKLFLLRLLNGDNIIWEGIADCDSTHVNTSLYLKVSILSKSGSPRILNNPIIHAILMSITNCKDGVINIHRSILAIS